MGLRALCEKHANLILAWNWSLQCQITDICNLNNNYGIIIAKFLTNKGQYHSPVFVTIEWLHLIGLNALYKWFSTPKKSTQKLFLGNQNSFRDNIEYTLHKQFAQNFVPKLVIYRNCFVSILSRMANLCGNTTMVMGIRTSVELYYSDVCRKKKWSQNKMRSAKRLFVQKCAEIGWIKIMEWRNFHYYNSITWWAMTNAKESFSSACQVRCVSLAIVHIEKIYNN